jgi:hypothetical protein
VRAADCSPHERWLAVNGPATFGDMLDVARKHLDQAAAVPARPADVGRDLPAIRSGMHALVAEIGRCLPGESSGKGLVLLEDDSSSPWPAACAQARRAATRAAEALAPPLVSARRRSALVTERGKHLHAAARALAAGRDLLATHVGHDSGGGGAKQSDWAAVLGAPAISRAAAAEVGVLAQQAAALGTGLAMASPADWAETSQARKDMAEACGYLRALAGAMTAAHRQEPVLAVDRELLRAVPVATTLPRLLPGPGVSVPELCQGVIGTAERLRHSANLAARLHGMSAEVSADSLRHAAAAAVAASHHCSVLLGALEECAGATAVTRGGRPRPVPVPRHAGGVT